MATKEEQAQEAYDEGFKNARKGGLTGRSRFTRPHEVRAYRQGYLDGTRARFRESQKGGKDGNK